MAQNRRYQKNHNNPLKTNESLPTEQEEGSLGIIIIKPYYKIYTVVSSLKTPEQAFHYLEARAG